jgi:hypothetical protein
MDAFIANIILKTKTAIMQKIFLNDQKGRVFQKFLIRNFAWI